MKKVYFLLILVTMLWGFNVSAIKVLVENIDPILLTALRIFVSGISVLILLALLKELRLPTKKELLVILFISMFNVVIHHIFMGIGLQKTSGVNAGLIVGTGPLFTMMLSFLLLKRRLTVLRVIGFLLGFIGVFITTIAGNGGFSTISIGDLYILISILGQAFSFILISKLNPSLDTGLLTGYMMVIGSIVIFIVSIFEGMHIVQLQSLLSWDLGLVFLFSSVLATAVGHTFYNHMIKKVGPAESSLFINFTTLFALIGSAVFLQESILLGHIIGLVFIVMGVIIGSGVIGQKKIRKEAVPSNSKQVM